MREIKFRAWDKKIKKIAEIMAFGNKESGYWWHLNDNNEAIWAVSDSNNIEIMQYTGLKDRSGVEIYEGDILDNPSDAKVQVVWDDKWAQFAAIDAEDGNHYGLFSNVLDDGCRTYEVIGNIYENPELLPDITSDKTDSL